MNDHSVSKCQVCNKFGDKTFQVKGQWLCVSCVDKWLDQKKGVTNEN